MSQLAFGAMGAFHAPNVGPKDDRSRQQKEIGRVSTRIAAAIRSFCRKRLQAGPTTFHADELREWVRLKVGQVAPDSPGRILRQLRQRGEISYELVSRSGSEYRLLKTGATR